MRGKPCPQTSTNPQTRMAKVFFSYSHDDEAYRDQLEKHLALLRHEGLIESWHDRRILAGADLNQVIDDQLNQADVILLLVSASFLSSRYCYSIEMARALERQSRGGSASHSGDRSALRLAATAPQWLDGGTQGWQGHHHVGQPR